VKQGFSNSTLIADEYGSARNSNITANKFGSYFSALLSKKQELNTLQDTTRKKQQINTKDNIWLVTSKSKNAVEQWFKDLSSNTKTLSQLSRKVPIFNKKEEIFVSLYEYYVPMFKAEWFIKMSCAYQLALSEANNKSKKRQLPDSSQEWTNALCRFLREQYQKLCEHYHGVIAGSNSSVNTSVTSDLIPKQWQYYTQLARHLFEAGLLDRHDFLSWLLDLLDKIKSADDIVIGIVVPLLLQYVEEFTQSELLSRKLAFHCAKKLSQLMADYNIGLNSDANNDTNNDNSNSFNGKNTNNTTINTNNSTTNGNIGNNTNTISANNITNGTSSSNQSSTASLIACFSDLTNCSHHRNVILGLSAIVQIITLDCPTSLIWLNVGDGKAAATLQGSPLDFLPCEPSNLPMPSRSHNQYLRNELRQTEEQIRQRSKMSEMHWSCDRWQQTAGTIVNKLLNVLDSLDRHCFDKVDSANSIETLYSKIFTSFNLMTNTSNTNTGINSANSNANNSSTSDTTPRNVVDVLAEDEPIVRLLCEWAVTTKRTGEHRALVVAKLLEKRQTELTAEKESEVTEENDSELCNSNNNINNNSNNNNNSGSALNTTSPTINVNNENKSEVVLTTPIFQNLLLSFLDSQAPVYEERIGINTADNKQAFSNLILLFGELIRCDVFSHDSYMCTLISRGQFSNSPNNSLLPHASNTSKSGAIEEHSLAGFVPNLSSTNDLPSLSSHSHLGLVPNGVQRSTSGSSLPMFDPLSNHSSSSQADQTRWDMPSMDIDEANLDEDLDKLLQHIKAGQQNMSDQAGRAFTSLFFVLYFI
jgi:mediator of RNA polymerase II transcription subunit 12